MSDAPPIVPNDQEWLPYAAIDMLYRLGWDGVWWECEKISSPATVVCMIHVGAEAVALYRNGEDAWYRNHWSPRPKLSAIG